MRRIPLAVFISLMAAGCGAPLPPGHPAHPRMSAALPVAAGAAENLLPDLALDGRRGRFAMRPGADVHPVRGWEPLGASPQRPALRGAQDIEPGAVLSVWLNDGATSLTALTGERAIGTALVRGDFFRLSAIQSAPDLRGLWNQPVVLKWDAYLRTNVEGAHVFTSELSKERFNGAMEVRARVALNGETLFEREKRVFGTAAISEVGSRVLTLAPGYHRLEVWLSVENRLALPPSTQLGVSVAMREPGVMTAEPVQLSRLWRRVRSGS